MHLLLLAVSTVAALSAAGVELRVAAAADVAPAQQALIAAFEKQSGVRVQFVTGSSGILARQIEHGAPYDVFLSANETFVQDLAKTGRVLPDSVCAYATGRLAWVAARRTAGGVTALDQLAAETVRFVAIPNPAHAPYGVAAKQALTALGLWTRVEKKVVLAENARQAFAYAESGNADVAITAWSILKSQGGTLVDAKLYEPIRQSGAVVATSKQPAAARGFLEFLLAPAGRAILESYGLGPGR